MKCPVDGSVLTSKSREGFEINFCPQCSGIWTDKGELGKIIQRAAADGASSPEGEYDEDGYHPTSSGEHRSFLSKLFGI